LRPEILDVVEVVRGIETMIGSLIGDAVTVAFDLSDVPCPTHADRGQLEQVLMNLSVNARDAMPDGGRLWIEVSNVDGRPGSADRKRRTWVRLTVRDDGCGIPEEIQGRLFEPFFTTKEQGKGTGLGLSSAYGIVRDSGGEIEVTSTVGGGSTFTVYLPRAASRQAPNKEAAVVSSLTEGSETILLVEDEEDLRSMAAEVLGMIGYTVLQAGSGEEAIDIWRTHDGEIDLLLTDVVMPGMSGGELVRQASPLRPETRVLYMSGYTDDTIVKHGVFASAAAFIQKPFRLEALSRKVREVLDLAPHGRSHSVA
jgi:CheY-like chemotaxis protein